MTTQLTISVAAAIGRKTQSQLIRVFVSTVLLVLFLTPTAFAQDRPQSKRQKAPRMNPGVAKFLARLDRNNNEILETSEMVGNTASYLQSLGFDPTKPLSMNMILRKIENKTDPNKANNKKESSVVRKVPGFGIETQAAGEVARFGPTGKSGKAIDMNAKYGERIMKLVERTIEGYDQNDNGALDPPEILRARWGNPKPEVSDRNHDGVLTQVELAERYLARDRDSRNSNRAVGTATSRTVVRPPVQKSDRNGRSSRSRARPVPLSKSSRGTRGSPSRSKPSATSSSFNTGNDRYVRYAAGLMTQYDQNKDGKLDKGELGKMRRPPKNADIDGDGFVTSKELTDVLSSKSKTPSTSPAQAARDLKTAARERRDNNRSGQTNATTKRSSSPRRSSSFGDLDKNQDGQVQMSEFSDDWDGEVFAQFQAKDHNGDGVITSDEWNGR